MGICDECIIKDGCKFADSGLIMKHCKNFIGEAPRKIVTNFDRITKSTEALAEFMAKHEIFPCGYIVDCDNCSFSGKCSDDNFLPSNYEKWLEWLKQESKE